MSEDIQTIHEFYNDAGEELARGFHANSLSFEFCDGVVNGLYSMLIAAQFAEPQPPWPALFYDVYLAFDAGEYHRETDASSIDPVKEYTAPMIGKIVTALSQSPYRPQF